jgi:ribosome-binding factor A
MGNYSYSRVVRLERLLQEELSHSLLRSVTHASFPSLFILKVTLSPDLSHADIVLGSHEKQEVIFRAKEAFSRELISIRKNLGKVLRLKKVPHLHLHCMPMGGACE